MTNRYVYTVIVILSLFIAGIGLLSCTSVSEEGENVFITDQTGEKWDVSQANALGFKPHGFQYGIGRHAFTPLGDEDLSDDAASVSPDTRVIGIANENQAHAYSIRKLSGHEIANTTLGDAPIVVGY